MTQTAAHVYVAPDGRGWDLRGTLTGWCMSVGEKQHAACRFPDECGCMCHESGSQQRESGTSTARLVVQETGQTSASTLPGPSTTTALREM